MRKLYLLKTFLLACLFSIVGGGMAWADGSDDFAESFTTANTSYSTRKSKAGWVCTNAALVSIDGTKAPTINGKTSAVGVITSPILSGGCGTLTFKYANTNIESNGVSVNVTVTDASGNEVKVKTDIVNKTVTQNKVYTATIEKINVAGDFKIHIKNNSPSNSKNDNKDRVSIWNIHWTGYSAGDETLESAGLSFGDPAPTVDADLYKPAEFKAPTLTNPHGLKVTYSSSDKAVATVDANTGVVTLVGVGSTTITASSEKTETYAAGSASYTLNVTDSSPYFRFAKTDYSVMLITAFTAPTVETNVEGTPAYSSSDPSVATVDSETGAVTLVAPGTTTITATLDSHSASYTLTVTPVSATVFAPVTAQSEVVDGGTYIVLNKDGDKAMGENSSTTKYLQYVEVSLNNGLYTSSVDGTNEPYAFQLVASGEYFKLKHGNTYLQNRGDATTVFWSSTSATSTNEFLWKIDLSTKNTSPIFNKALKRQLGYNAQAPRFATYTKSTSSYSAVLYRQYSASDLQLTIRDAGYATYYSDKAFVVPAGMEATTVTAADNDGTLTMAWEYQAGSIVPAATAVLLRGEAATYNAIQLTDCTVAAPTGNLLHGSTIDAETEGGKKYYKLTYGTIGGQRKFGFFWGAANGAAFINAAGKAYLAVPAEIAATGFRLDGMDATGIGQVEVGSQHANAAYSLSGVRVDSSKPLPAGAYIINGRKVIVK